MSGDRKPAGESSSLPGGTLTTGGTPDDLPRTPHKDTSIPDCQSCGACCVSPFLGEGYIQVSREEERTLHRLRLPLIEMLEGEDDVRIVLLGTRLNREGHRVCRALEGTVGKHVACTIYASRPHLCREFEAGSPECFDARRAVGLG